MLNYLKQGKYTYSEDDLLGQGSFGKAYKGYNNHTKQQVALKQIELLKLEKGEQLLTKILLSEITVMRKFNKNMQTSPCPYLVRQQDVFRTDKHIYIVMEICTGGTLQDQLRAKIFNEKECILLLYCICKGLKYMNQMGIVHRDLKPQNIFISQIKLGKRNRKPLKIYKIGDFGFADQKKQFDIAMGTFPYMAPEMFKKQKYTSKVDNWSVGIIAYQVMFGGLYFIGKDKWEIQKNIKQKPFVLNAKQKSKASINYQDFISKCLNKDPKFRIDIDDMLKHELFKQINKQFTQAQFEANQVEQQIQNVPVMKQTISQSENNYQQKVFSQQYKKKVNDIQDPDKQYLKQSKQQIPRNIHKITAFQKVDFLINECKKMRDMAEKFQNLSECTPHVTQFIQIYLLKDTYVMMNRLTYTALHKQNHIQLQEAQFQTLLHPQNIQQYQQFYDKCLKECEWTTGLFNQKYKWFMNQYILKFREQDQLLIQKVINQQPYEFVNNSVLEKQLKKWQYALDDEKRYGKWKQLKIQCRRILDLKLYG